MKLQRSCARLRTRKLLEAVAMKQLSVLVALVGLCLVASSCTTSTSRPPAPVEIRLALSTTHVVAGTQIRGEALLTNTTSRTITVNTCAIDGWLFVGLRNSRVSYEPIRALVLCSPTAHLRPGVNRVRGLDLDQVPGLHRDGQRSDTAAASLQPAEDRAAPACGEIHDEGRHLWPAARDTASVPDQSHASREAPSCL